MDVGLKSAEIVTDTLVLELINRKALDVCLNMTKKSAGDSDVREWSSVHPATFQNATQQ